MTQHHSGKNVTGATNVTRVQHSITQADREKRNGHKGGVVWLTGLSGSGKSTLALELEKSGYADYDDEAA